MESSYWTDILRPLFAGRKVIVKTDVAAASTGTVRQLRSLGAAGVLVLATNGAGAGELPGPDEATLVVLDAAAGVVSLGDAIRASNAITANLPGDAVDAIDAFDPDGRALAIGDFLNDSPLLAGRPFLGYRRPEWVALDDKTTVDALWERAGVARAESAVVDTTAEAVRAAFAALDRGMGVVVAADSSKGWHGGAEGTRWVKNVDDVETVLAKWIDVHRNVRVMPFLEGIPCSIHGVVFDDVVVAFRPVEMVVLRRPSGELFYAGCSSFYDPPDADRAEMRALVRRVGAVLRCEVGFRGAFTVDGVMTADGFRPTELNPRNGAGLGTMLRGSPEVVPLQLLLDALVAGVRADWCPAQFEHDLLATFDVHRSGGTWRALPVPADHHDRFGLAPAEGESGAFVVVEDGSDHCEVDVVVGPSPLGVFVRAVFVPERTPIGRSVAGRARSVWAALDERLQLGIGPLDAASDARQ